MPQSLSFVLIHVIFSTKDRAPILSPEVHADLRAYLATVCRNADCECYRVGGVADHVHLAIKMSRTIAIAALVETLKTSSSRWLKSQGPALSEFAWQNGYGAFSVSASHMQRLVEYIENQETHHARRNFQEEFRILLKEYGVDYDERYVWG